MYLIIAFNMLGSVSSVRHDEEISTIHVEYHDRSVLRPYSFTDHRNYSMASLCELGAVFACEGSSENNVKSTLYFKPVETWATKSDWHVELNDDENVKGKTKQNIYYNNIKINENIICIYYNININEK